MNIINMSELWKACHKDRLEVNMRCKYHSSKWRGSLTPAGVKQFSRLHFTVDTVFLKAGGNRDNIPRVSKDLDAKKYNSKLSKVYTGIKKHDKMKYPLKV
jgi:hypothetical protein